MKKLSLILIVCTVVFYSVSLEPTFLLLDKGDIVG